MKTVITYESAVRESLRYLASEDAIRSLDSDTYWPKWHSPWWHVTLLNEMGLVKKAPEHLIQKIVARLKASPIKIFPIHAHEIPAEPELARITHCHCSLGNIYQALAAYGVDVDQELPWIKEWFLRYQLPDGGLNCDESAYLQNPPPSSMVGTIAPLEAVLFYTGRPFTDEEASFLDRGAKCLIDRKLMRATSNPHNREELDDEEDWFKLCFPRFYFYDVLRGLHLILRWADTREQSLPRASIAPVVQHLENRFSRQQLRIERRAYEGMMTISQENAWDRKNRRNASMFSLLEEVSDIGEESPFLVEQWNRVRELMVSLENRGLLK